MTSVKSVVDVDKSGFLVESRLWTPELAAMFANEVGITDLDVAHWKIIDMLREYYKEFSVPPSMRELNNENKKFDVTDLFPNMLIAWRVAGLPNPGEEAKVYMINSENDDVIK